MSAECLKFGVGGPPSTSVTYDKALLDPTGKYRNFDYQYSAIVTFPGSDDRAKFVELTSKNPIGTSGDVTVRSALTSTDGTVVLTVERREDLPQ